MTLREACDLAIDAAAVQGVTVIAVGRFVPPDEIRPGMPWRVSVAIEGHQRPRMLNGRSDLAEILPKQPPAAPAQRRAIHSETPMLF